MKTILVPLDGSAMAEQVLPSVRMLAPRIGAKVKLLHTADPGQLLRRPHRRPGAGGASDGHEEPRWAPRAHYYGKGRGFVKESPPGMPIPFRRSRTADL